MTASRIMQIVGLSNSGKTSLILDLMKLLEGLHFSVAVIKSAKNHEYTLSNKDSERFLADGAISTSVSFSNLTQINTKGETNLSELISVLKSLTKPDIILIEGYKKESYDKILVWSSEFESNVDLFNLNNLKSVYCQKEKFAENSRELMEIESKFSVKVVTAVNQLSSLFVR